MTRQFQRGALAVAGALVAGLIGVVLLNPLERATAVPKASFRLAVSQPIPPRRAPTLPVARAEPSGVPAGRDGLADATGIDSLTGVIPVAGGGAAPSPWRVHSADALSDTFSRIGYDLERVSAGEAAVPRLFLGALPGDLKDVREVDRRKSLFFKTLLPLVLEANNEILRDRRRLWRLHVEQGMGRKLGAVDRLWLMVMTERYKTKPNDIATLLRRVDVIPPSLALAQAAEESGWGTSRFVREGNAIFGQWTFSNDGHLVPKRRDDDKLHRVKSFPSLIDSVRAYIRNLNTHNAYRAMRRARGDLRLAGLPLEGRSLAEYLSSYSARGKRYIGTLKTIIEANDLHRLDDARLHDAPEGGSLI